MDLSKTDRARITDTVHSIQLAQASLVEIDESKVPEVNEIQECLDGADRNLRRALRRTSATKKPAG
jgi:hypothetical protein